MKTVADMRGVGVKNREKIVDVLCGWPPGWKKCEFIWAYLFMKSAQNNHPTRLFGT